MHGGGSGRTYVQRDGVHFHEDLVRFGRRHVELADSQVLDTFELRRRQLRSMLRTRYELTLGRKYWRAFEGTWADMLVSTCSREMGFGRGLCSARRWTFNVRAVVPTHRLYVFLLPLGNTDTHGQSWELSPAVERNYRVMTSAWSRMRVCEEWNSPTGPVLRRVHKLAEADSEAYRKL